MAKSHIIQDPTLILGQGYSTDEQMAAPFSCFNTGNITIIPKNSSNIYFGNAVSFQDIQKSLNVDVTASAGIGPFSTSDSAMYAQFVEQDYYSQAFYYYGVLDFSSNTWNPNGYGPEILNSIGQGAYQEGPEQFRLVCGDQIVTQVDEVAGLYYAMYVTFSSAYDKQTFQANAGGNFGDIISVSATVNTVAQKFNLNGEVTVSAFQVGGNPSDLPLIFNKGQNGYYITSCSLQDLQACQSAVDGVLAYAQGSFLNQTITGNGVPINPITRPVDYLGINTGNTTVTPDVQAARGWLGQSYFNQTTQATFVGHLLSSPFMSAQYVSADILNELSNQNTNLQSNIAILDDQNTGVIACYTSPTTCIDTQQAIQQSLNAVNTSFIDQFNNGYSFSLTCSDGGSNFRLLYPIGNNVYSTYLGQDPTPPYNNMLWQLIPQEAALNTNIYESETSFNCGLATESSEFPDQYNVSYIPGEPYYATCFLPAIHPEGGTGIIIYDYIDNPI